MRGTEQREDVLLSNLSAYAPALGGKLELVVRYDDDREPVWISQFDGASG